jgi:hypothetical protein
MGWEVYVERLYEYLHSIWNHVPAGVVIGLLYAMYILEARRIDSQCILRQ